MADGKPRNSWLARMAAAGALATGSGAHAKEADWRKPRPPYPTITADTAPGNEHAYDTPDSLREAQSQEAAPPRSSQPRSRFRGELPENNGGVLGAGALFTALTCVRRPRRPGRG